MKKRPFDFVYYVWSELLVGDLNGHSFCIKAVSGGGRGSVKGKAEHSFASFSPHRETNKTTGQRGGTIPPGLWRIEKPSKYKGKKIAPVAKLTPLTKQTHDFAEREYEETPFLIHGRGDEGSDGCLVIEPVPRKMLLNAVEKAGGATLLVTLATRPGDLIDRSLQARSMA